MLADKLMFAFATPSGIPLGMVNLMTGEASSQEWLGGSSAILSEAGSVQLELRYLSKITKNGTYAFMGDRAMATILKHHGTDDLYPKLSDVNDGTPTDSSVGIGAVRSTWPACPISVMLAMDPSEPQPLVPLSLA